MHYLIRFENTGTFAAENIVVTDMIDLTKFDVATLVPLSGSHPFETRISSGNKVEFIFENIMLPFDLFKIKTKPTLVLGNTFSNTASIYFDYNFPIVTNTATTTVAVLGSTDFDFPEHFSLYPNPAANVLNISSKTGVQLQSVEIYNLLGQKMMSVGATTAIDGVCARKRQLPRESLSDKGSSAARFIKQ